MEFLQKENLIRSTEAARIRESEKVEKILLTIASGTLALSVTFFVNSNVIFFYIIWLKWSWGLLSFSLIFILISYVFAELHFNYVIKTTESFSDQEIPLEKVEEIDENIFSKLTRYSNYASLFSCITGIIFLTIFGFLNISLIGF